MVVLGSNHFTGVLFPLQLGDRFFHIADGADGLVLTVFRWRPPMVHIDWEVVDSQPKAHYVTTNVTGIIIFTREEDGSFELKFRPDNVTSAIFGSTDVEEVRVRITDHKIEVTPGPVITDNSVVGGDIGFIIRPEGGLAIGGALPPELRALLGI